MPIYSGMRVGKRPEEAREPISATEAEHEDALKPATTSLFWSSRRLLVVEPTHASASDGRSRNHDRRLRSEKASGIILCIYTLE
jgi:hypothetical protein